MVPVPSGQDPGLIQVFLGTKAQYIKTAPLLRLLDEKGVPYRLIDSGQHAKLTRGLRQELGVREPDTVLSGERDIETIPQAMIWAARLVRHLGSRARLRDTVFGGRGGICVIHGDTPSTLVSAVLAKRAGLEVAHLEAGLTSGSWRHPFPEELIRSVVHRMSDVLFTPNEVATRHLQSHRRHGRIVELAGNTGLDALQRSLPDRRPAGGPVLVTVHRVENLHNRGRMRLFLDTVFGVAARQPVRFVVHGPTRRVLDRSGDLERIRAADGIEVEALLTHEQFVSALHDAPFVITDGGSIQEECALLGVPTLLWRDRTERPDGVGANVVVSHYDVATIDRFLRDPAALRQPLSIPAAQPSHQVLDVLTAALS